MRIGLLECDDVAGRFPGVDGGYREMFAALLPGFEFAYYAAYRGALPASPLECEAWICTGSKHAVYEAHAWLPPLFSFVREVSNEGRPFIGVCFGHQVLAQAMGGEVAKASQGWGVGVLPVEILREEPWMDPPAREIRIQHMHQDQVQKLPPGAVLLGRSPHCDVGLFRVGERMLGIEGHPEFTVAFGRALIESRRQRFGEPLAQRALESLGEETDASVVGSWITRFIRSGRR